MRIWIKGRNAFVNMRWLTWKYLIRRFAHAKGFIDPILILARLERFAQPSEVNQPIELLRAGFVFHARGLINTKAIQHNLDWVWPYWVERQFNPYDPSFIPRAFSISHINLTHRNWTAIGLPYSPYLPIIDPSGLITPFYDGWSLDAWVVEEDGSCLLPSKMKDGKQKVAWGEDNYRIITEYQKHDMELQSIAEVLELREELILSLNFTAKSLQKGWLVLSIRPYNPEGISFISSLGLSEDKKTYSINGNACLNLSHAAEKYYSSTYQEGDVFSKLLNSNTQSQLINDCPAEMPTTAALFVLNPGEWRSVNVEVSLNADQITNRRFPQFKKANTWKKALSGLCLCKIPDITMQNLYDGAIRTLLLHAPDEVFPGPYTYKRFWFRDSAFMLNAMLVVGMFDAVEICIDLFPAKQTRQGYFLSQEGEWDSNGEALWMMSRYVKVTKRAPKKNWIEAIHKGAHWIINKRKEKRSSSSLSISKQAKLVKGLLPVGFSAEHLGLNDYYYWDDFWGVAGLESAAELMNAAGHFVEAQFFKNEAMDFRSDIDNSVLVANTKYGSQIAIAASPLRRLDSGAIGSLAASYPLKLWDAKDSRLVATTQYLLDKCLVHGGFFQDMIHSGMNAYLTLHLAQTLLRDGNKRYLPLVYKVAEWASPTGQWPEAIHPNTLGGCMGDGQHAWAAAEWVLMISQLFFREEGDVLILLPGIPEKWLQMDNDFSFGPCFTIFGLLKINVTVTGQKKVLQWEAEWTQAPSRMEVHFCGAEPIPCLLSEMGSLEL